jgi:hypothetical protein
MLKSRGKCPRPGVAVVTRGGLIGSTTGDCEQRKVEVRVAGFGDALFKRSELKKVTKTAEKKYLADVGKFVDVGHMRNAVIKPWPAPKMEAPGWSEGAVTPVVREPVLDYSAPYPATSSSYESPHQFFDGVGTSPGFSQHSRVTANDVRRVKLDSGGYDHRGMYWGVGEKLWQYVGDANLGPGLQALYTRAPNLNVAVANFKQRLR